MTTSMHAIEVPADECYVAVAPRPPGRVTNRVAAYAVEGQLPRPIEDLCLAWRVMGDTLVVVAVDRERADAWLANGVLSARSSALPAELGIDAGPIELLAGEYLPAGVRAHRRRRVAALAGVLAIGMLATAHGLHTKTGTLHSQERDAAAATVELAREALPQWRDGLSPQLALTGEQRRLRALARGDRRDEPPDSRDALAALLRAWPSEDGFRVESLEAEGHRVTLRAIAPSREAAVALAGSLAGQQRFEPGMPRVRTEPQRDGQVTHLELSLTLVGGRP